jgi:hypothetical protein
MEFRFPFAQYPLLDAHCHGVVTHDLTDTEFEALASESRLPARPGCSPLDSPIGLAIRRWCAPVLDLPEHAPTAEYLRRRRELGSAEVNRRLIRAAGLHSMLVDTGFGDDLATRNELATLAAAPAHEVLRLETLAETLLAESPLDKGAAGEFAERFEAALDDLGPDVVAFKSILAYRCGFDIAGEPPSRDDVVTAVIRWQRTGAARLTDPVVLRFLIWAALSRKPLRDKRRPLQLHTGFGDTDLDLHRANPILLTGLIREAQRRDGAPIVLLHCYPYHREAAYLAAVYPNVHLDIGLGVSHLGPSAGTLVREAMELAPFGKLHYSSDAYGLAEFFLIGAMGFRAGLDAVLGDWVSSGAVAEADARAIAAQVLGSNSRGLYPIPAP